MIVAHDISHGLNANQQVWADGLRRRDTLKRTYSNAVEYICSAQTGHDRDTALRTDQRHAYFEASAARYNPEILASALAGFG